MKAALDIDDLNAWLGVLKKIVDVSTNVAVVTEAERRIKWVNATYTRITGCALSECLGNRLERCLPPAWPICRDSPAC